MSRERSREVRESTGAWVPRVVFGVLVAALLVLGAAELRNVIRKPSLVRLTGPGKVRAVLYQKGRPGSREAWLMHEPKGSLGPPVCIQRIGDVDSDQRTGDLCWSQDGALLYAAQRRSLEMSRNDEPLWVFDFGTGRLWVLTPRDRMNGETGEVTTDAGLRRLLASHGGRGPVALRWQELGKAHGHLLAWQVTRWERVIPEPAAKPEAAVERPDPRAAAR